eukprot:10937809-Ditylum_brightwellii.AAC.2
MYPDIITKLEFEHAVPYLTMDNQDEVMSTLIKTNKLYLHQVFDTPFVKKGIQDYIGENGMEQGAKEILEGNFDPDDFDNLPAVNYWIKNNLKHVAASDSVNIAMTV